MIAEAGPVRAGAGALEFQRVRGKTVAVRSYAASPLKWLHPRSRCEAAWVYSASYGGGLLGGDRLSVDLELGPEASVLMSNQASTKVFRSAKGAGQSLKAKIGPGATFALICEPVACFAGSSYEQEQDYELSPDAALVSVDWMTSGRADSGERWAFDRYSSRTVVRRGGKVLAFDSTLLESAHGELAGRLGGLNTLASVFILGARFAADSTKILEDVAALPLRSDSGLALAASPLEEGLVLRLAAASVERLGAELEARLQFLRPILGGGPWAGRP